MDLAYVVKIPEKEDIQNETENAANDSNEQSKVTVKS